MLSCDVGVAWLLGWRGLVTPEFFLPGADVDLKKSESRNADARYIQNLGVEGCVIENDR